MDLKKVGVADVLTMGNGLCGILAIVSFLFFEEGLSLGTAFIFLGMIFDGSDGMAARHFGTKHDYGRYLDSISDSITFCVAPGVMVATYFFIPNQGMTPANILSLLASAMIAFLGIRRLVKFSLEGYKLKHFSGLATPANTFFVVVMIHFIHRNYPQTDPLLPLGVLMVAASLQVVNVEYPKVRGKLAVSFAVIMGTFLVLLTIQHYSDLWFRIGDHDKPITLYQILTFLALGLVAFYVLVSPILLSFGKKPQKPASV